MKFRNLLKMSIPILALYASSAFYSCEDPMEEPVKPTPEKPIDPKPVDTKTYIFNIADIPVLEAKADSIKAISESTAKDSANVNITNNLYANTNDFTSCLKKLSEADEKSKVTVQWNNNKIYSAAKKTVLDSIGTMIAVKLPIGTKDDNYFYVDPKFKYMIPVTLKDILKLNEPVIAAKDTTIIIKGTDSPKTKFTQAINATQSPTVKDVIMIFSGKCKYKIEDYAGIDQVLINPRIKITKATDAVVSADITVHPTLAPELTKFWGMPFMIDLTMAYNQHATGTSCAIIPDNRVFDMIRSKATNLKTKETHPNLVFDTGNFNPMFCMYRPRDDIEVPAKVDLTTPVAADFTELDGDITNGGNGGFIMMEASFRGGSRLKSPIIKNAKNTVITINLSEAEKYNFMDGGKKTTALYACKLNTLNHILGTPSKNHKSYNSKIKLNTKVEKIFLLVDDYNIWKGITDFNKLMHDYNVYLADPNVEPIGKIIGHHAQPTNHPFYHGEFYDFDFMTQHLR